jgi:YebC/PmpR family DNA-binding regulatory protein
MAGHNKWSKVKHIKAKVDVVRGKVFSKCAHEIAIAARDGGGDPSMNPRLRAAIDGAKAVSMPKEKIERAIKKGTGELGGEAIQETSYEGYGPEGIGFLIEASTDNLNRTAADIRTIFTKGGGSVADPGSVAYQFDRKGEIRLAAEGLGDEQAMEAAILAGADDVVREGDEHIVLSAPESLAAVAAELEAQGLQLLGRRLVSIPQVLIEVDDPDRARQVMELHDRLDEHPDVIHVFTNFDVSERVLAEFEQ